MAEPDLTDEFRLEVGGVGFADWKTIRITRALSSASGSFDLTALSISRAPFPIRPGFPVTAIAKHGSRGLPDTLISGHVDTLEATLAGRGQSLRVGGRDATAQLVDCSAVNEPGEFQNLGLEELARQIAEPFSIEIVREVDVEALGAPFPLFKLQPGETAWSAIERAARLRAVLVYSNGSGALVLATPGGEGLAAERIVSGKNGNVIEARVRYTYRDRFRYYTVRGQDQGNDEAWGETVTSIQGTAEDPEVDLFRPLVVVAEGKLSFDSANDRAAWEATFRAARSATLDVTLPGWRQGYLGRTGDPWRVNLLVDVEISELGLSSQFLIDVVTLTRDRDKGTLTKLRLVRADAYTPKPEIPKEDNPFADFLGEELDLEDLEIDGLEDLGDEFEDD